MIAAIGQNGSLTGLYPSYHINPVQPVAKADPVSGITKKDRQLRVEKTKPSECQTCKNRTYVDGSHESNVSFKSPGHISPAASYSTVSAHENMHVANAKAEGAKEDTRLVSATVSLHYARCPECGRTYVDGGTTRTVMQYNLNSPYERNQKSLDAAILPGMNFDAVA